MENYPLFKNIPKGWALITGATDGIGLEMAKQLSMNYKIILVSRTLEKLATVSSQLNSETKIIACDLTKELTLELKETIKELKPNIVINNAGLSYDHAEYLEQIEESQLVNLIRINCTNLMLITRLCLGYMKEQRFGLILNVGSGNARLACGGPLYSVYSASKAFVETFSKAMHYEVKEFGVTVQCVIPYYVSTKMSRLKPSCTTPTAKSFVASVFKSYQLPVVVPNWIHYLMDLILSRFSLASYILKMNKAIRTKALSKKLK